MKRIQGCMIVASILAGIFIPSGLALGEDNAAKVTAAAAKATEIAKKSGICVEISLSAVENALAAEDVAEAEVLSCMKSGVAGRIAASEKKLQRVSVESAQAREMAKKVIDYSAECTGAAVAADEEAKKLAPDLTDGEVASSLKRVERLVEIGAKALKKAEGLSEALKKKWLLPVLPKTTTTTTTSTTTTTQPPSPTPVGRR